MFCPSCGKQNRENVVFCAFCGKALPQNSSPQPLYGPAFQENPSPQKASGPKVKVSFTAVKAIITTVMLVGLVLVVLQMYYPAILPWN